MIMINVLLETSLNKNVTRKVFHKKLALIEWRCEVKISESDLNKEICYHHEKMYLTRYLGLQKYCCDPYNTHGDHFITSKWKKYLLYFFNLNLRVLNYNMIRILFLHFLCEKLFSLV